MILYNALTDESQSEQLKHITEIDDMLSDIKKDYIWNVPIPAVTNEPTRGLVLTNKEQIYSAAEGLIEKLKDLLTLLDSKTK